MRKWVVRAINFVIDWMIKILTSRLAGGDNDLITNVIVAQGVPKEPSNISRHIPYMDHWLTGNI